MEKNSLDSLFKRALSMSPVVPDERAWTRLEERLHKKRGTLIWRYVGIAAAAAVVLAVVWTGYFIGRQEISDGARISSIPDSYIENQDVEMEKNAAEPSAVPDPGISPPGLGKQTESGQLSAEPVAGPKGATPAAADADVQLALANEDLPLAEEPVMAKDTTPLPEQGPLPPETDMLPDDPPEGQLASSSRDKVRIRIVYKKGPPAPEDQAARDAGGLFARGVKKLEDLASDIGNVKISDEAKARIRNTREEVLAFNIEKIFRKEDKKTEQ